MDRYAMPQPESPPPLPMPVYGQRRRDILVCSVIAGIGGGLLGLLILLLPLVATDVNVLCYVPPLWNLLLAAGAGMAASALLRDKGYDDRRSEIAVGAFAGLITGFCCGMFTGGAFSKATESVLQGSTYFDQSEFSDPNMMVVDANSLACCAGICGGIWAVLGTGVGIVGALAYGLLEKHVFAPPGGREEREARREEPDGEMPPPLPPPARPTEPGPILPSQEATARTTPQAAPPAAPPATLQAALRAEKRTALARLVRAEPNNAQAWLELASYLDDPQKKRDCLRRVLALTPQNETARRMLEELERIT